MNDCEIRRLIAAQLAVSDDQVIDEARFVRDLGADSLDLVSVTMVVEERFDVAIEDDEIESCATVRDAIDLLQAKLVARQPA